MNANVSATYPSLAEQLVPGRGWARGVGLVVVFSAVNALAAQVSMPLPFTPVPISGQTFAVLLTGMALGPRLGFAALVLYLGEGAAGLPVFAGGAAGPVVLAGPTGGYLLGFPLAAALVGWLAVRGWDRRPLATFAAMVAGNAVIYAVGLAWLGVVLGLGGGFPGAAGLLTMGMLPFLPGDAIKAALATVALPAAWRFASRGGRR